MPSLTTIRETILRLLGPGLARALGDPEVTELYTVEGDSRVWLDTRGNGRGPGTVELAPDRVEMLLNAVASATGVELGPGRPILSAELPEGLGRLQGFLPPVSVQPLFILRKPAPVVFPLAGLVEDGFLPHSVAERLRWALSDRETVLVVGGTGTGKTTFLNTLLLELARLCPGDRIALLEDTPELVCSSRDFISLRTAPGVDLYGLLDAVLRASPHRIVVGEVRDHSALAMLDAWNTGHPGGLATLHANSCEDALLRLATLVQRANVPPQTALIAATVRLVVLLEGTSAGRRRLAEVAQVQGVDPQTGAWRLETFYARAERSHGS